MDKLTTPDIAKMFGVHISTVEKWATANDLEYIQVGRKKFRIWTEADIARFQEREKPGRRW